MRTEKLLVGSRDKILNHVYGLINYDPKLGDHFHHLNAQIEEQIDKIINERHGMVGKIFYAEPNLTNIEFSLGLNEPSKWLENITLNDINDPAEHWKFTDMKPDQILSYVNVNIIK